METGFHQSVMLAETIDALAIRPDGLYVDGTFGRGGHATAILQQLGEQGKLIALDKDPVAVQVGQQKFAADARFSIHQASFAQLKSILSNCNALGQVQGILLDLGVSSPQLDDASRGFSFQSDGPLDMRMNPDEGISAAQWLSQVNEQDLVHVLREYGEEKFATRIARRIIETRLDAPILTTKQLAELIRIASPFKEKYKHPATRSFQAIRIFINRELEDLESMLAMVPDVLALGGRLVVLSFHSLEDRIVKRFITTEVKGEELPRKLPIAGFGKPGRFKKIGKAMRASEREIAQNPRARSAMLRVAERVA